MPKAKRHQKNVMLPQESDKSDVLRKVMKEGPDSCNSPEEACCAEQRKKHPVSPQKMKNKRCKSANGEDAHSSFASPKSRFGKIVMPDFKKNPDPYYLEENREDLPEITWDYDSPKTEKDLLYAAKSMTISHLLENLTRFCKDPECKPPENAGLTLTKSSKGIQLSPSCIDNSKMPVDKSPEFRLPSQSSKGSFLRKRWRRRGSTPEMTAKVLRILESLCERKETKDEGKKNVPSSGKMDCVEEDFVGKNIPQTKFDLSAEGSHTKKKDSDYLDEIWDNYVSDDDNVIVTATQECENQIKGSPCKSMCSYIPETPPVTKSNCVIDASDVQHSLKKNESSSFGNLSSKASEVLKSDELQSRSLVNVQSPNSVYNLSGINNWDSVLDDDWSDLLDLSKPSEVRNETEDSPIAVNESNQQAEYQTPTNAPSCKSHLKNVKISSMSPSVSDENRSNIIDVAMGDIEISDGLDIVKSLENFNDSSTKTCVAEDEFFKDEGLLNDPEVLKFIDMVESQSILVPKCLKEEIASKRAAALKKLQKNKRRLT